MPETIRREIRDLRALFWSDRDPDGRAFAPLADALRRAGDLVPALELLADGLDRLPDFVSGHVVAGWVNRSRGANAEAEISFRRALRLDSDNVSALRGLGFILAEQGKMEEAVELFRRLDEREPGDPDVQAQLLQTGWAVQGVVPIELLAPDVDLVVPIESLAPDSLLEGDPNLNASTPSEMSVAEAVGEVIVPIESLAPDPAPELIDPFEAGFVEPAVAAEAAPESATQPVSAPEADDQNLSVAELARRVSGDSQVAPVSDDTDDGSGASFPKTRTMAELYASQGLHYRALTVLEDLMAESPDDPELVRRRDELLRQIEQPTAEDGSGTDG